MALPITKNKCEELTDNKLELAISTFEHDRLTPEQFYFCELHAMGEVANRAAKLAGYRGMGQLLKNKKVLDCLELMRERANRYANTTRAWRKMMIRKSIDRLDGVSDQALKDLDLKMTIQAENAKVSAVKILNELDQETNIRLTLEDGINSTLSKLEINVSASEEMLGKLFHTINLNDVKDNVIEHEPESDTTH